MKVCKKCLVEKDLSMFHKCKGTADGLQHRCKDCQREWVVANRDKTRRADKRFYYAHPDNKAKYHDTLRGRYVRFKSTAKSRGKQFLVTEQEFYDLIAKGCFYCGDLTSKIGLDRVNNTLDYTLDNVVSCCYQCNSMKMNWTKEEFITKCKLISSRF